MARKPLPLDANPLLGGPTLQERGRSGVPYRELNVSDIDVDPDQPRREFDDEALHQLAESIRIHGLLNPILVRKTDVGTYRIVAGERRFRAIQLCGLNVVPAVVDQGEDSLDKILAKQLVENLQREDLTPLEKASSIGQLADKFDLSVRQIATDLGLSKSAVQRSLEVRNLPDDVKESLRLGLSESKALMIGKVSSAQERERLLKVADGLSRQELEQLISEGSQKTKKVSHGGTEAPVRLTAEDRRICDEVAKSLGVKATMSRSKSKPERGKFLVEFYSSEDLKELHRRLVSS